MTAAIPIIAVQCMSCSAFVHPAEVVRIGESVIKCWACYEKHTQIIESWESPPKECAVCKTGFDDLAAQVPGQPVSMFMHEIDGTFGMLCVDCDRAYVAKRRDLYGKTRFWHERNL